MGVEPGAFHHTAQGVSERWEQKQRKARKHAKMREFADGKPCELVNWNCAENAMHQCARVITAVPMSFPDLVRRDHGRLRVVRKCDGRLQRPYHRGTQVNSVGKIKKKITNSRK